MVVRHNPYNGSGTPIILFEQSKPPAAARMELPEAGSKTGGPGEREASGSEITVGLTCTHLK